MGLGPIGLLELHCPATVQSSQDSPERVRDEEVAGSTCHPANGTKGPHLGNATVGGRAHGMEVPRDWPRPPTCKSGPGRCDGHRAQGLGRCAHCRCWPRERSEMSAFGTARRGEQVVEVGNLGPRQGELGGDSSRPIVVRFKIRPDYARAPRRPARPADRVTVCRSWPASRTPDRIRR